MTYTLVETYSTDNLSLIPLGGRSFPAECLIEDEDGIRWYLGCNPDAINARAWVKASTAGAAGLIVAVPLTPFFRQMTTETFMEEPLEKVGANLTGMVHWTPEAEEIRSYPDLSHVIVLAMEPEPQPATTGFVHLHTHTEYSSLDGLSTIPEIMEQVVAQGQTAVAATDHGYCFGHPELQAEADKAGVKPIFGIEAYFVDDRLVRPGKDETPERIKEIKDYWHLVLWAKDDEGLRNLWAMSTESEETGKYYKPRMDWDTLAKYSKGVIASTACLRGPLAHGGILDDRLDVAQARLGRLMEIFGDDLYLEIHANQLPEQIKVNEALVKMSADYGVPLVAAVDSHYAVPEDKDAHRVWLSVQTNKDVSDDSSLFAGGQDYHLQTEAEVRKALAYLGDGVVEQAVSNTAVIADACNARIQVTAEMPVYSKKGGAEADAERLLELALDNWGKIEGKKHDEEVYIARMEREFRLLVSKGFCGYFLSWADLVGHAKKNRILVGPGRGSGGGSLVAYLVGITDIDPVEADLLFERFLTEGRVSLPDFDVDFPTSAKDFMYDYAVDKYGFDKVVVVGSVMRFKSKGILKKLASALGSTLPDTAYGDMEKCSKIIKRAEADTAGLGLSWEALWDKVGDELQPYADKYPYLFEMAGRFVGRVNTYGQHAAGVVISMDRPLSGTIPMRRKGDEGDGKMIAQWDKDVLEGLGLVKYDMLSLTMLDTIQLAVDKIRERRGIDIDVYSWRDEYHDEGVWDMVASGATKGIFQIDTPSGTGLVNKMHPHSLAELADCITLVRPGPTNSGLTKLYLERRAGRQEVTFPDPRLETVLARTWGTLIYQEDVMATCMVLAGYDSNEADGIRKILGKKQVAKVAAAGEEFTRRAVDRGMAQNDAEVLWAQMAEFSKYSFNRAHAWGYAVLGTWCAWLKFHYPVEYLAAALSTVDKDDIPSFIKEARTLGVSILPPDINESGSGFKALDGAVRYGLDSVKGVGAAAITAILPGQPFSSYEDFIERKGAADMGVVRTLAHIGAFDSLVPNRRGLETRLLADKEGVSTKCVFKDLMASGPNNLPCRFDWDSEPAPLGRTGKALKKKPPPKKCTVACRNYTAPEPLIIDDVEPYTDEDIRAIEVEALGVFLTGSPFDRIDSEDREFLRADAIHLEDPATAQGTYLTAALITEVKPYVTKSHTKMGFVEIETEVGSVRTACFSKTWENTGKVLKKNDLVLAEVEKTDRGFTLTNAWKVP